MSSCESLVVVLYMRIGLYAIAGLGSLLLALISLEYGSRAGGAMNGLHAAFFFALGLFALFSECSQFETAAIWGVRGYFFSALLMLFIPAQWLFLIRRAKGRRK